MKMLIAMMSLTAAVYSDGSIRCGHSLVVEGDDAYVVHSKCGTPIMQGSDHLYYKDGDSGKVYRIKIINDEVRHIESTGE